MMKTIARLQTISASSLLLLTLAACATSGGTGSPGAFSNTAGHAQQSAAATLCTTQPVQAVAVTTTSLIMDQYATASFVACAQFAGDFSIAALPAGVVSVPATVTPAVDPNTGIKLATINVTAVAPGPATITVTDKKGNTATVTVTVKSVWVAYLPQGPYCQSCPPSTRGGIEIVTATGHVVNTLPIDSSAVALDDAGNVYNLFNPSGSASTLQRYALGSTTPNTTYQASMSSCSVASSGPGELSAFAFTAPQVGVWKQGTSGGIPDYTLNAPFVVTPCFSVAHDGTIYLAQNDGASQAYAIYPPGSATPARIITETIVPLNQQGNFASNYMTVGPDGTVYVTEFNYGLTGAFLQPDALAGLYIYPPNGSERFVATTSDDNGAGPQGVDLDGAGNVYVANSNSRLVGVDTNGNPLWSQDTLHDVEVLAPGATSVLRHISGNYDPYTLAVAPDGTLFVTSGFLTGVTGTFGVVPGGGTITQIAQNSVNTIALYNGAQEVSAFETKRRATSYSASAAAAHAGGASLIRYLRMNHRIPQSGAWSGNIPRN